MFDGSDIFANRQHAGRELAKALEAYRDSSAIVLAIPRGGVVVGYEVASELHLDLDVIVPRKIGAPNQPELAIGAIASWGDSEHLLDDSTIRQLGVSREYIESEVRAQIAEINRRLTIYRHTTDPPDVEDRTVILVDDGIATGYTTRAAIMALQHLEAAQIILAIPVAPPDSLSLLRPYVDEIVCLKTPSPFLAVGYWYRDFGQVPDSEVMELLSSARSFHG